MKHRRNNKRRKVVLAILIAATTFLALAISACVIVYAIYGRLGIVKFTMGMDLPFWLQRILWGW